MNNKKLLKEKYSSLFTKRCEFRYDEGWNTLIESICFTINKVIDMSKKKYIYYPFSNLLIKFGILPGRWIKVKGISDVTIDCIKEKFGGLRIYYHGGNETIYSLIYLAEVLSYKTCEKCSNADASITKGLWLKTLCNQCKEKEGLKE